MIRSAFHSVEDAYSIEGKKPVIFDILSPDMENSMLGESLKMVLHVNPTEMKPNYSKVVTRTQTQGGFVEEHWGDAVTSIDFNMATGGFVRLYSGLSNITAGEGATDVGGSRRESIAYDKYLDLLALFHNNANLTDANGSVVYTGIISITFDEGTFYGWFQSFDVTEDAEKPFMFMLNATFLVNNESRIMYSPGGGL